jgi:hypothetical protein
MLKSKRRTRILQAVMDSLKSPDIYGVINYKKQSEDKIKSYQHQPLLNTIKDIYEATGMLASNAIEKAKKFLIWESNVTQTLNNMKLFGVSHRPDFLVLMDGMRIAVEIKKGKNGSSIREGIGQSITYSHHYDFVVYLYIDITEDKRILNSIDGEKESNIIADLWSHNNVMFDIV